MDVYIGVLDQEDTLLLSIVPEPNAESISQAVEEVLRPFLMFDGVPSNMARSIEVMIREAWTMWCWRRPEGADGSPLDVKIMLPCMGRRSHLVHVQVYR